MRLLLLVLLAACDPDPVASSDAAERRDLAMSSRMLQTEDGGVVVDLALPPLPQKCPCPLGSYCDLSSNTCKRGCLGDDHCPNGQACDTTVFLCTLTCKLATDCPNHLSCEYQRGIQMCHGCTSGFDDCNHNPDDGCEASLDTLANCGKCGQAAKTECLPDSDGDGYVAQGTPVIECHCSSGRREAYRGIDCDDTDPFAYPGQTGFFEMPRKSGGFDYDCDGKETPLLDYEVSDTCFLCSGVYWVTTAPACGAKGQTWGCSYDNAADKCQQYTNSGVLQKCR